MMLLNNFLKGEPGSRGLAGKPGKPGIRVSNDFIKFQPPFYFT